MIRCDRQIGGIVAVDHDVGLVGRAFRQSQRGALQTFSAQAVAGINAVSCKRPLNKPANTILRQGRHQHHRLSLFGDADSDVAGRASDICHQVSGILDPRAVRHWIDIHAGAADNEDGASGQAFGNARRNRHQARL